VASQIGRQRDDAWREAVGVNLAALDPTIEDSARIAFAADVVRMISPILRTASFIRFMPPPSFPVESAYAYS
jgi:hypothetical protein